MDYRTFKRHLGKAGLKVGDFARIVDVKANAISNYSTKPEVPQTHALLAVCFGEIVDSGGDLRGILARYEALPASYVSNPSNASIIQFDMFKEVNARRYGTTKQVSDTKTGSPRAKS